MDKIEIRFLANTMPKILNSQDFNRLITSHNGLTPPELPPIDFVKKMRGNVLQAYQLPTKSTYKVFNTSGKLISEGNAQFIDFSKSKKGTYIILYGDGQKGIYEKK